MEQTVAIKEKYHLSEEEVAKITDKIITIMAADKMPSKNPLAIIVGGQSGSGKTALINYTAQISDKREFIEIDNDFFRGFHPQVNVIKTECPDHYAAATDQLGLGCTAEVLNYFISHKYNIILHQTLRGTRVVDDAMTKLLNAGYTVGVRAFAVPYFESKMSQIERCEGQIEALGFCRHVNKADHDAAIEGLPKTVEYIEASGKYDFIEIFKRGKQISAPELVYARLNNRSREKTLATLEDCTNVSKADHLEDFQNAKEAVEETREREAVRCATTLADRIHAAEVSPYNNPIMQQHIDELKGQFEIFKKKHKKTCLVIDNLNHMENPTKTIDKML